MPPRAAGGAVEPPAPRETAVTTAVLMATAPAAPDGAPAAALAFEDTTVVGRLLGQVRALGIADVHVVAREGAGVRALAPLVGEDTLLHASPDTGADLRLIAALA